MGLFNVFKKKENKPKKDEFTFQMVKTDNVSRALSEISKRYNIPLSNLDFDILDIETFIKFSKDGEFVSADQHSLDVLQDTDMLLDENFEIKQSYEIKIRKYRFIDDFELVGKMKVNKELTKAVYNVSPSSLLFYDEHLIHNVIEELNKKKIKSGFLVNIRFLEGNFIDDVDNLAAKIQVLGSIEDEYEIELCKAQPSQQPVPMRVLEVYKKNETTYQKVKELIYPIKKGETIIEIIKPKEGRNGRNCRGELIKVNKLKQQEIPEYKIDDAVTKRENEKNIKYIANKNGYVYIKQGVISIKEELEVNQISLKTGNIKGAEDSDVRLEVKESGVLKEAIKDGMIVETTELLVKGNVGNGAKIKAKKLEIDGQTHKGAKILAQNAEINAHKGYLKANTALIHRLEGGIVEAKQVHINQAISGKVIAKEIKVDILGSHVTFIASELIEIETLKGSENRFIIDEGIVNNKQEYIKSLEDKLKDIEIKIRHYKDLYKKNKQTIMNNQDTISLIKEKVAKSRENKKVVNPLFIQKIKKFNDFVKKTKLIDKEIKMLLLQTKKIKDEMKKMQDGVFIAKIISHSGFKEFNRIEFHLTEPPMKITYDIKSTDKYKTLFMLKDYGEMEYKIVGEEE